MPQKPVVNVIQINNNPKLTSSLEKYNGTFTLLGGALKLAGAVLGPTLQDDRSLLYQSITTPLITMAASRFEDVVSSPGRELERDIMGVTLNDVKELSNPSAPLNDEARKGGEDGGKRGEQEKRDREEREKQQFDPVVPHVRLLRVRFHVHFAFVSMI